MVKLPYARQSSAIFPIAIARSSHQRRLLFARIAITGISIRCALGATRQGILRAFDTGVCGLKPASPIFTLPFETYIGAMYGPRPHALPAHLAAMDTHQARVAVRAAEELLPAITKAISRYGAHRVAVIMGTTTGGMADTESRVKQLVDYGDLGDDYSIDAQHNLHSTADVIAAFTGVKGPVFVQSSACSSSAKVMASAARLIRAGVIDAAIVGGVDTLCRYTLLGFNGLGILSSKRCQPFGAHRDGINLGEAAALMLLEREDTAHDVQAWLRAVGESADAYHATQPRPDGSGLARAISAALAEAGLKSHDIDLVNAHATGTLANDRTECLALASTLPHRPPVVGTKGWTGHTLGASSALEAAFVVFALQEQASPGTLTSAPLLDEHSMVSIQTAAFAGHFRYGLSTSAAFAGHNAAVVLERA